MLEVVVISQAKVTVEHEFGAGGVLGSINSLPLSSILSGSDESLRTPTLGKHGDIEVVVEDSLVSSI